MTVSTTCIVNFCNDTVVLCKLLTFELTTYIELRCSYTPIKPSFSRVTRCGCDIPSAIDSLLARGIGGIVFACVKVLATKPPFSQLYLHCDSPAGLADYFTLTRGQCSKCQVFYLFYGSKSTLYSLIIFAFHSPADAALTVSFGANSFVHLTSA